MLCEKCEERAATVHLTLIGPSAELSKHHFCENCFPAAQEKLGRAYNETAEPGATQRPTTAAQIAVSTKSKIGGKKSQKQEISKGPWTKCTKCGTAIVAKVLRENLNVCPNCQYHFSIGTLERIRSLVEIGSFEELDAGMTGVDVLHIAGMPSYQATLADSRKTTGQKDAVMTGIAMIGGHRVGLGVMDFGFMNGSMGSVVGEKLTRLIEKCWETALPVVIVSSSGGARVHEGMLSLMQMAKTCGALGCHSQARLPFISVLAHPTMAGVLASFASVGGLIVAEPGAMIGFAGPRVIKTVTKTELPKGFQTAEFLLDHGLIDAIVPRNEMKKRIIRYLDFMSAGPGKVNKEPFCEKGPHD